MNWKTFAAVCISLSSASASAQLSVEHFGNLNVNAGLTRVMNDATLAAAKKAPGKNDYDGGSYRSRSKTADKTRLAVVELVRKSDPAAANRLTEILEKDDIVAMFSKDMAPYGLAAGNVADAVTAFLVANWMIANQAGDPDPAQVRAVRTNIAHAMGPSFAQLENEQRQFFAELLIYQTMFAIGARTAASADGDSRQQLADATHRNMLAMGMDMRQLELGADGLVPK